jgi:hypothetical protein
MKERSILHASFFKFRIIAESFPIFEEINFAGSCLRWKFGYSYHLHPFDFMFRCCLNAVISLFLPQNQQQ